ncbi:MAG TPA: tetratricopeptide repeat protein [Candidatus Acidoferrum sp.]|jgi:tetratricopeptide (TPR) repeat protein|nr:tetratricopeptide repeat protein [Candidatus Acidoferrum sp.]
MDLRQFRYALCSQLVLGLLFLLQLSVEAQSVAKAPPSYDEIHRLTEQGKFDDALAELDEISKSNPTTKNLSHEFGVTYYRKGDYRNAITALQRAIAENPDDTEATQLIGLSLYLSNKPAEAIPYLVKVQSWYPSANVDASYILGVAYIQMKDYASARRAFAKMFQVPPDSAAAYLFTARLLLRLDFAPVAEEYGKKAIELDAKLPLAHQVLGELYLYENKLPEATAQLQQELAINPGNPAAYYKLADAYSRAQKFDEAEKLLQRSIWLDANSSGPYILLGKVLEKKGESELAVRALQRALAMDPNNSVTHHLLGQSYRALGRMDDAERELKMAESLQAARDQKP